MLTTASIWRENMHGYLSADIICSKMRTVFRERSSRRFMWFEEQIMSKEQYTRIISLIVEAFVVIILQVFCNACEKMFTNRVLLPVWGVLFFILLYDLMNKQFFPSFSNNYKTLSHFELNFKRGFMVVDVRFKIGEYHLGDIHGYPPVLGGNIRSRNF